MESNPIIPREKKTLIQFISYFGSSFASFFLGFFNRIVVTGTYPSYSTPDPLGWAGLASFLGMYGIIGGVSVKYVKNNSERKRSLWFLIVSFLFGVLLFILGFINGVKNPDKMTAGTLYGVYSHQPKIEKK